MSNNYIKRTTLFRVVKEEDIERVLKQYEILRKTAVKVCFMLYLRRSCYASFVSFVTEVANLLFR